MTTPPNVARAAIGITVKSGWAAVVLVGGEPGAPTVLDVRRVDLSDPDVPEGRQPYHAGFGTARNAGPELARLVASVARFGRQSVGRVIREYSKDGHYLTGVGAVVGSLTDPKTIANTHIRIHALEGRLFRSVVEDAAKRNQLDVTVYRDRDLFGHAADILKESEANVRTALSAFPRPAGSWRGEQKAAALAAWLVLARGHSSC